MGQADRIKGSAILRTGIKVRSATTLTAAHNYHKNFQHELPRQEHRPLPGKHIL